MMVRIHRGAEQIGGTCIELSATGDRIAIDFGLPLDADPTDSSLAPNVAGDDLRGVVISHPHIDHYGLLHHLTGEVPVAIGSAARQIIQAAAPFTRQPLPKLDGYDLMHGQPINVGVFRITPYQVDHSAYDAYALLIEAEGKRLFYSGDFRGHGRNADRFEQMLANPPENIDVLFMEGSSLSHFDGHGDFPTEAQLEEEITSHLNSTDGLVLFHTSAQNIDRVVSLYRACQRSGRPLVIDLYTAAILAATRNPAVPQSDWPGILIYLPKAQAGQVKENQWFSLLTQHSANRIYIEQLQQIGRQAVILFRPLMMTDLDEATCLEGASFIYSQWAGYLEQGVYASMEAWLSGRGIKMRHIHTSGHASPNDLKRFAKALAPRALVPIHSFAPERFREMFDNVILRRDGDWWEA